MFITIVSSTDLAESLSDLELSVELSSESDLPESSSKVGDEDENEENTALDVSGGDSLPTLPDIQNLDTPKFEYINAAIVDDVEFKSPFYGFETFDFLEIFSSGLLGGIFFGVVAVLFARVIGFLSNFLKG